MPAKSPITPTISHTGAVTDREEFATAHTEDAIVHGEDAKSYAESETAQT